MLGACSLLFGGCASLSSFFGARPAPVDPAAAAATPERAVYRLDVIAAPEPLRRLLLDHLDLARFQNAPATDAITNAELDRLVAAAPAQARTLLQTEGYFDAEVVAARETAADGMAVVRVQVTPGAPARIGRLTIDAVGDLERRVEGGEPAAKAQLDALRRDWALPPGQTFRQPLWTSAKNATLARLRAEGYPAASWSGTSAEVDTDTRSVRLFLVLDSGPRFLLGPMRIEGLERYDEASVRRVADFAPGTPYSEKLLLDYQERLQKIGLFEGASVEVDPDPQTADAAPVIVRVRELSLQQATLGVGVSANTGARVTLEHTHRKVFGQRWIAKNKFEFGPTLQSWNADLLSYPLERRLRNLVGFNLERLRTTDEVRNAVSARIGRTQDTERIERLYFGEAVHTDLHNATVESRGDALSANYHWTSRKLDSVLLPTRGTTLALQGALGFSRGRQTTLATSASETANGPFARAYVRWTGYYPIGDAWYTTTRLEAGQVLTRNAIGVPDTLLFRAGGDDSVRGYEYRSLGPMRDGALASGRSLATASVEVARPIFERRPEFWWAAFVDAGNAADTWGDLQPALGYGVGVRWRSPVGPLRLDLAYGQDVQRFRLHLSVGIAL
jgi:translocation and assembly module TamA